MKNAEQRVVFSKKHDEKFVNIVEKYRQKNGFVSFKAALKDLTNKGLQK